MKLLSKVLAGITCLQQRLFVSEKMSYNIHFLISASLFWVLCSCYYRLFFSLFFDLVISKYEKLDYRTRKLSTDIEFLNNCINLISAKRFLNTKWYRRDCNPLTHINFHNAFLYIRKLRLKNWTIIRFVHNRLRWKMIFELLLVSLIGQILVIHGQ